MSNSKNQLFKILIAYLKKEGYNLELQKDRIVP